MGAWRMTAFFDWLDLFLATNAGTFGALFVTILALAIVGAIAELES